MTQTGQLEAPEARSVTMPSGLPELTLGWGVLEHMVTYLRQPDGPQAGERWNPIESQVRWLLWWYALDPEAWPEPRWIYNHGKRRLSKGSGKSPFAAAMSIEELVGPVRFDRWKYDTLEECRADEFGGAVGKPCGMALVQIAGMAESQALINTMRHVRAFLSPGRRIVRDCGLEVGKTMVYAPGGSQLQVITSSAVAAEGALVTFSIMDQTESWNSTNGGSALARTITRNLAKSGSRGIETANAWVPGADSIAEVTFDAWCAQQEGKTRGKGRILYDARKAPDTTSLDDLKSLEAGLRHAYGDCYWVNIQDIIDHILDTRNPIDESKRFYLNWPEAAADAWTTQERISRCADPLHHMPDKTKIALGFDGSRVDDSTALIGCEIETGYQFKIGIWTPDPQNGIEVPVAEVDTAVEFAFERWHPVAFFADVKEWESFTKVTWPGRYRDQLIVWAVGGGRDPQPIAWDMRGHEMEFTKAAELMNQEIEDGEFKFDGDSEFMRHFINARRRPNKWGISLGKESRQSKKKIDGAVAAIIARRARQLVLASDDYAKPKRERTGRVWGF